MRLNCSYRRGVLALLLTAIVALQGCDRTPAQTAVASAPAAADYTPVTVQHALGTTVIAKRPQRVVALDMNEVDFLDQLGVPVAGMPKDFVPQFLAQ